MRRYFVCLALGLVILQAPAVASTSSWSIDPDHSTVEFKVRHLTIASVRGVFSKLQGFVNLDDQDITKSSVNISIDAASINTGIEQRDQHLRSAEFFNVTKYPTITFVSKKVRQERKDQLKVIGDLTIHGVTREVVLDVTGPTKEVKGPRGEMRRGAGATTAINRRDFGLTTWQKALETGEIMIGNEVAINLEIEMVKAP
jgi:polyisoprenoid-binding protein YceI